MSTQFFRATGLLIIEAINSNPNGDPDRESDPRQRPDEKGEISPVSFKRKLRDLVADTESPVWQAVQNKLQITKEEYCILESRGRDRKAIEKELKEGKFTSKYWDARIFGNTFLEDAMDKETIKTGPVQFGMGVSIAPINILRQTNTNKAGVQEGKTAGMAPLAHRIVEHGVYCMPFFVNPHVAHKSGCTTQDIELMKFLIPYAYNLNRSAIRPFVEIRHAWFCEHQNPLGSASDYAIIDAFTPRKKGDSNEASKCWDDYDCPTALPEHLNNKVNCLDLMTNV